MWPIFNKGLGDFLKGVREAGFTLIEVMIAVAILAVISLLVWQTTSSNLKAKDRYESRSEFFHMIATSLNTMAEELSSTYIFSSGDQLGMGISGDLTTRSLFKGEENQVTFTSFAHLRLMKNSKESDQAEMAYYLKSNTEERGLHDLMKREESPPNHEPEEGGVTYLVLEGLKRLEFRYYDGEKFEWREDWDSSQFDHKDKIPRAVQITMAMVDPEDDEKELVLSTMALLDLSPGPNDF